MGPDGIKQRIDPKYKVAATPCGLHPSRNGNRVPRVVHEYDAGADVRRRLGNGKYGPG